MANHIWGLKLLLFLLTQSCHMMPNIIIIYISKVYSTLYKN
jgi:hypothetical protein